MSNWLRLKRRASGAVGAPASLKSGELAWNMVDGVIYAGSGDDGAGNATSIVPVAFTGNIRAIELHCAGKPDISEVIGGTFARYAMTISPGNSLAKCQVGPTATVTITIKKNGTSIGTITFAAGATTGSFSFTSTAVAKDDWITFHWQATTDSTFSDLDVALRE